MTAPDPEPEGFGVQGFTVADYLTDWDQSVSVGDE